MPTRSRPLRRSSAAAPRRIRAVPKLRSSQWPSARPISVGRTIAQPRMPIWPSRLPSDGSGSSRPRGAAAVAASRRAAPAHRRWVRGRRPSSVEGGSFMAGSRQLFVASASGLRGPQIAQQSDARRGMQPICFDPGAPYHVGLRRAWCREHCSSRPSSESPSMRLAARDRHIVSAGNQQHPSFTAQKWFDTHPLRPAHHGGRQDRQEVGMARSGCRTAGFVLRAQRRRSRWSSSQHVRRRGDRQMKGALRCGLRRGRGSRSWRDARVARRRCAGSAASVSWAAFVERADHVERAFLPRIALAGQNRLAAGDRVGDRHRAPCFAREGLGDGKGLGQEALASAVHVPRGRGRRRPVPRCRATRMTSCNSR